MKTATKQRRPAELPAGVDRGAVGETKGPAICPARQLDDERRENKIFALRLTPTEQAAVEQLVRMGYFRTASHMLRDGLQRIFDEHKLKVETLVQIRLERLRSPMRRAKRKAVDAR